jgi:hypothetical protein
MNYVSNSNFRLSSNYKKPNQWSEHSTIDMIKKGIVQKHKTLYGRKVADETQVRYEHLHNACNEVIHGSLTFNVYATEFEGDVITYSGDLEEPIIPDYWEHATDLYFDILRGFTFTFDLDTPEKLMENFGQYLERKTKGGS